MIIFIFFLFFFNDTATTEIYTLSLHDALPILEIAERMDPEAWSGIMRRFVRILSEGVERFRQEDRKSTRLNSSHVEISYAVFCLKKKKKNKTTAYKFIKRITDDCIKFIFKATI